MQLSITPISDTLYLQQDKQLHVSGVFHPNPLHHHHHFNYEYKVSPSYENALYKLCDILVDAHKSYPFTDIVKDIVVKYFKGLVSADITDDMKEIINWIDEDDGEQSERDENFDDETYGSLDTLDNINTDDYVPQLPPSADTEWPEHLLHFRHPIGYTPDQITEHS
jgi:hypothetical protein